jgi:hypothetical protein
VLDDVQTRLVGGDLDAVEIFRIHSVPLAEDREEGAERSDRSIHWDPSRQTPSRRRQHLQTGRKRRPPIAISKYNLFPRREIVHF